MVQGAGLLADGPGIKNRTDRKWETFVCSMVPESASSEDGGRQVCLPHPCWHTYSTSGKSRLAPSMLSRLRVSFFALQIDSSYDLVGKSLALARTVIPEKSRPTSPHWRCLRTRVTDSAKSS